LISFEELLGNFENGLWKEGILARQLKRLSFLEENWFMLNG
jgi:hypothetical protein